MVGTIVVTSEKAVSEHDVKIGMAYSDFDAKFPDAELHGSEIEGHTHATVDEIHYHLDDRHWEYDLDKSKIDKNATINNITIQ